MGKAIVIDGLQVTNPLCTVTFADAEGLLLEYLTANASINAAERTALINFVQDLIDAGIWDKMIYFYPLLGSNLTDALLDAVSPSTEDLFVNNTTGLSVSSRKLIANNRAPSEIFLTEENRVYNMDLSKFGMIIAGEAIGDTGTPQGTTFFVGHDSTKRIGLDISKDTYRYPSFVYSGTAIQNYQVYSKVQREVFGTVVSGTGYLYDGTTQLASENITVPSGHLNSSYGVLYNYRTSDYEYDFFAITEGMTTADWLVFHPLLMTFLQAVGKRAE